MNILATPGVTVLERDVPRPTFSSIVASEIGKGGQVEIVIGEQRFYVPIDPETGRWTWTPDSDLAEGTYSFSVRSIDNAGNASRPNIYNLVISTTPPGAPTLFTLDDDQGDKTGFFKSGDTTDDLRPTLAGHARPGAVVVLMRDGVEIGSAVADAVTGLWSLEPTQDLEDGANSLTLVTRETFAGKVRESAESEAFTVVIGDDATTPGPGPAPGLVFINGAQDSVGANTGALRSGAITDDSIPELRGTAPANSVLRLQYRSVDGSWIEGGTVTVSADGGWSWSPTAALADGGWEFRVRGDSGWTDEFALEIDSNAQSAMTITHATDNKGPYTGELASGVATDDDTPTLHGRAEANSIVYIHAQLDGSNSWSPLGSVLAGPDGRWSLTTSPLIVLGSWNFKAGAGETVDPQSETFRLDIITAGTRAPAITGAWDDVGNVTGPIENGKTTNDTRPELRGTAEANALVMIEFGKPGEPYSTGYTAIANARGEWSFTPPDVLDLGEWVFRAKAGNGSAYSNSWSLTVTESELITTVYDFEKIAHQTITGSWKYEHLTFTLLTPANVSLSVENASAYGNNGTAMKLVTSGSATNSYVRLKVDFEVMVNFVQMDALDWEGKDSFVAFFNSRGEEIDRVYAEDIRSNIQQQLRFYTEKNEIAYMELNVKSSTVDFLIDNVIIQENYNPLENIDSGFAPFDINKFSTSQVGTYEFEDGLKMVIQNNPGNGVISTTADGLLMRENATQEFRFGATDKVQFDIVKLNNTTDHKIEIHLITGEVIHTQTMDRNGTYYFEAPEGKLISHIVFTNGTESGTDTGYYLDNLTWGNNVTSKTLHHWTFDNNTLEGWTLAGDYAKSNSGNNVSAGRVNLRTDAVGGNTYSGQVMYYDVVVEKGKTYDFSFSATRVTTNYGHPVLGMTVGDITVIPATTIVSGSYDLTGSWTATESGTVRVAVTNNTATGAGNDFYLDSIKMSERLSDRNVNEQTTNSVDEADAFTFISSVDELEVINGGDGVDTLVITGEQQTLVLSDVADKLNSVEVIDITGSGDNRLEMNVGDVLSHGGRDLFISDGKLQFMVQGNEGDTVQLDDLLPDGTDSGDWVAQNGTVTVAGIEYQVFSHSGEEAEVLIQHGIKTELI